MNKKSFMSFYSLLVNFYIIKEARTYIFFLSSISKSFHKCRFYIYINFDNFEIEMQSLFDLLYDANIVLQKSIT